MAADAEQNTKGRRVEPPADCAPPKINKKRLDKRTHGVHLPLMKMTNTAAKVKKQIVKILGYSVTVGSKKHALLVWQQKHFNDLANN